MLLNKNLILFVSLSILFRVLLETSYVNIVSQNFAYAGYRLEFSKFNYVASWLIFFSCFFLVNHRTFKVSDYFFVLAFLSIIAPICVLFGYDSERNFFPLLVTTLTFFSSYV